MNSLQTFFIEWLNLLTLPETYSAALSKKFFHVLGFALTVTALLALLRMPLWYIRVFPDWRHKLEESLTTAVTHYPADRSFSWTGSYFTTTPDEPLAIQFPAWWDHDEPTTAEYPTELAYIVPTSTASATLQQELESSEFLNIVPGKPWMVLTNHTLSLSNWMGDWASVAWKDLLTNYSAFTLDKASLVSINPTILTFFDSTVAKSWPVLTPVLIIMSWLSLLFTVLWESIFAYFFLRLSGVKLKYQSVITLTTYLALAASTVSSIAAWIYPNLDPIWYTAALWAYFFVVLYTQNTALQTHEQKS